MTIFVFVDNMIIDSCDRLDRPRLDVSGSTYQLRHRGDAPRCRRTQTHPLRVSPINRSSSCRNVLRISEKVAKSCQASGLLEKKTDKSTSWYSSDKPFVF